MSTLIIWVMVIGLVLVNIMLRIHVFKLEARLKELSSPQEQLVFLRQQAAQKDKIPEKKENSADALRDTPSHSAPMIVDPERDVPGINARH